MQKLYDINKKYKITKNGSIYSNYSKRFVKPSINGSGYLTIYIGDYKKEFVHRVMCEIFLGAKGEYTVNHKNGIKTDNRISNLEIFETNAQQTFHSRNILKKRGKYLTVDDVVNILKERGKGRMVKDIAKERGITRHAVSGISTGRFWPCENYPIIKDARRKYTQNLTHKRHSRVKL